jgi:hypothetical protein
VQVIRDYYQAINDRDFERAYHEWGDNGAASNQSFDQFRQGYDQTDHVVVEIGQPSRIDAPPAHATSISRSRLWRP